MHKGSRKDPHCVLQCVNSGSQRGRSRCDRSRSERSTSGVLAPRPNQCEADVIAPCISGAFLNVLSTLVNSAGNFSRVGFTARPVWSLIQHRPDHQLVL